MDAYFRIEGGRPLYGRFAVKGAKNAVLPLLAGATLTDGEVKIKNCPRISDVDNMLRLLSSLGCEVEREGDIIKLRGGAKSSRADHPSVKLMRSSMLMLGALLARRGEVCMPLPGGCRIGSRPLDIHIDGLTALGARANEREGKLYLSCSELRGADVHMRYPSVGATENILMCASLAKGTTRIFGGAKEPEVLSLANGLNALGAKIEGAGGDIITVRGRDSLGGGELAPIGDRIVAGTLLAAVASVGGDVNIEGADAADMSAVIDAYSRACEVKAYEGGLRVLSDGLGRAKDVITAPYPGFPTDMQPQTLAYMCGAEGKASITETVFENRFSTVAELRKLGADITLEGNVATATGTAMRGARIAASDLRSGAGLAIAALKAEGESRLYGVNYIDRGYEDFEGMFSSLGADISREED